MFRPEQIPDVLEALGWYDSEQHDPVHRAVLTLSLGDADAVVRYVVAAVRDFRDVLLWASEPEPPKERAAAREGVRILVLESEQRRHRYLEGRFGVEGAEQIERSNRRLFGTGPSERAGTD